MNNNNPESNHRSETSNEDLQLIQRPSTPRTVATTSLAPAVSSTSRIEQLVSRYIDPQFMTNNFPNIENLTRYIITGSLTVGAVALIFSLETSSFSEPSNASFNVLQNFLSPQNLSVAPIESIAVTTVSVAAAAVGIRSLDNGQTGQANHQSMPSSGETASSNTSSNFEFSNNDIRIFFEWLVNRFSVGIIRWMKIFSSTLQTIIIGAKLWHFCKKVLLVDELKEENAIVLEIKKNLLELGKLMTEGHNQFEELRQQIMDGKFVSGVARMEKLQLHTDRMRQIINKTTPLLENVKLKVNGKLQELVVKKDGMLKRGMILGGISFAASIALELALSIGLGTGTALAIRATTHAATTGLQLALDYNITSDELEIARTTFQEILRLIKDLDVMVEEVNKFQETLIDFMEQHEANNGLMVNHNQAQVPVTSLQRQQLTQ